MYINLVFIGYIAAIFISLLCLMLIFLVLIREENRQNQLSGAIRNFAAVVFLIGCLYFIFYYRETVQGQYELNLAFRIVDYLLCCSLYFLWCLVMAKLTGSRRGLVAVGVFTGIRLVLSLYITATQMGPYYNIDDPQVCKFWMIVEIVSVVITIVFLLVFMIRGIRSSVGLWKRGYITVCSITLIFHVTAQAIVDTGLSQGRYGVSAWQLQIPDSTVMSMFMLSVITLVYVFHEDFTPLYFAEALPQKRQLTTSEKLDMTAMEYQLTTRERELLEFLYQGYSNPEISGKLFISVNTVKKHIKNIYEKLGINTRVDLVHIVDEQKYPVG